MKNKKLSSAILFLVFSAVFFSTCDIGLGASVDTEAPVGAITSPVLDAVIRDEFAIQGTWSDDGSIKSISVELKNTGTSETFSYSAKVQAEGTWYCVIDPETEGISDGSYLATIVITDKVAHQTSLTRSYTIDNTPPLIVLTTLSTKASSASADSYGRTFSLKGQAADDNNVSKILVNVFDNSECSGNPLTTVTLSNVPLTIELEVAQYDYDSDEDYKENAYYKIYGEYDEDNPETKEFYCTLTAYDDAATYPLEGDGSSDGNSTTSYYLYSDVSTLISTYKVTEIYHMLSGTYTGGSDTVATVKEKLSEHAVTTSKFSLNPDNAPTFTVEGTGKLTDGGSLLKDGSTEIATSCKVTNDTKSFIVTISPGRDEISIDADNADHPLYVYLMQCDSAGNITGTTEIPLLKAYLNAAGTDWIISDGSGSVEISDSSYVITTSTISTDNYGLKFYNSTSDGIFYRLCVSAIDEEGNKVVESNSRIYAFGLASSAVTIDASVSSTPTYLSVNSSASGANKTLYARLNYTFTDTDLYLYRTLGSGSQEKVVYDSTASDKYLFPRGEDLSFTDVIPVADLKNSDGTYASKIVYKFISSNGENIAASNNRTVNIKYDNVAPLLGSTTEPSTSETTLSSFSFSGSASDADSGLSAVYINITDNADSTKTTGDLLVSGTEAWTYKISSAALPEGGAFDTEGKKTVKIWAVDNVGIKSSVYTNSSWIYDTSEPVLTITSYTPEGENSEAVALSASATAPSFNIGRAFKLTGKASDKYGIEAISVVQSQSDDAEKTVTLTSDDDISYDSESGIWTIENLPRSASDSASLGLPAAGEEITYTYTFVAEDKSGATVSKTLTVTIDRNGPVITVTAPSASTFGDEAISGTEMKIQGTASDSGLGMAYIKYAITTSGDEPTEQSAWTSYEYTGSGNWSISKTVGTGIAGSVSDVYEGKKYLYVKGIDKADNESEVICVPFCVDQTAPVLSTVLYVKDENEDDGFVELTSSSAYSVQNDFYMVISAEDSNSIASLTASASLKAGETTTPEITLTDNEDGTWTSGLLSGLGTYTITIKAVDGSGNSSGSIAGKSTSQTITVLYDNTAPSVEILTAGSKAVDTDSGAGDCWVTGTSSFSITGSACDDESGLASVKISIDGNEETLSVSSTDNSWTYSCSPSGLSENDKSESSYHTIIVTASNKVGQTTTSTAYFRYDKAAPSAVLEANNSYIGSSSLSSNSSLTLSGRAYDTLSSLRPVEKALLTSSPVMAKFPDGIEMTLSTSADNFGIFSYSISSDDLDEGTYTFTLTAYDYAGLTDVQTATVVVDKTAPSVTPGTLQGVAFDSLSSKWFGSTSLKVIAQADDGSDGSGIDSVEYNVSSAGSVWGSLSKSGDTYSGTITSEDGLAGGNNTIKLRVTDKAGNVYTTDSYTVKIDTSEAELEALLYKVGDSGTIKTAGGTVYSNGSASITIYGLYEDAESGVEEVTFALGSAVVNPSVTYSASAVTYNDDGSANSTWISDAEADGSESPFQSFASFTDKTEIKSWKAVYTPSASGKLVVSGLNGAGTSSSTNAFTITFDTTDPKISNISLKTSSDSYSVYQPVSGEYNYWVNNTSGSPKFTLAGIATDNTGVDTVSLTIGSGDGAISYNLDDTASVSQWSFSNIDLSSLSGSTSAEVTVTDNAGNTVSETVTINFDTTAPVSLHLLDAKNKDIYFRIGSQDNDVITDSDLDKDVGGKYSNGTYGNSTSIKIRGNMTDSGAGLSKIYYKVYSSEPSVSGSSLISDVVNGYTGYITPLSSAQSRRVYYSVASGATSFGGDLESSASDNGTSYDIYSKTIDSTFVDTISGFTVGSNYLVFVGQDNVGNTYLDSFPLGSDADSTSNEYASINVDVEGPSITSDVSSQTIYSNGTTINGADSYTLTGNVSDLPSGNAAGIDSMYLTVNGTKYPVTLGAEGANSTSWSYTLPASIFANSSGNITVYAVATDLAGEGNESSTTSVATICVDRTAPTVTLAAPTDADAETAGTQVNGTISLSGTVTDGNTLPDSAVYAVQYSTDKTNWTDVTTDLMANFATNGNYSYTVSGFDTTKLTDETQYYVRVAAKDVAGNIGYSSAVPVYVSQDSDRPLVTFTNLTIDDMASSNYVWLKNTTTLMGIATDDDGISSIYYSTDNSTWTDITLNNGSWSLTLSEGSSVVYFKITDSESSTFTSELSASSTLTTPKLSDGTIGITTGIPVYLKVDKTSPVTKNLMYAYYDSSLASPAYTDLSGSLDTVGGKRTKVQINLDAGDENDIESVAVTIGNLTYAGEKQTSSEEDTDGKLYSNWTVSDIDVSALDTGNTYATLTITDMAGLTKTDTLVLTVDNTYSTVSVKSPASTSTVSGEVSAYGTLTETATLYYSVSPSASDPDSVSTVSSWLDSDGNSTSMTAVAVDGWTQIEDASLSWTVNFNNVTDGSASGTNTKSLNKYIIDYGIAAQDLTSSASDAIVSSFETYVTLYIHLKSVDAVGNEYVISYPLVVDPQGDRPSVSFSYPSGNAVTLGGKVSIYGTATDTVGTNIGVDSVWVQLKSTTHGAAEDTTTYGTSPSYDSALDSVSMTLTKADLDYMASSGYSVYKMSSYSEGGSNTAWTSGASLGTGESASDYAALATLSGAAWNITINAGAEFDPPSGISSNPVAIRVFARDGDGKFSMKADRYVSFDADTPVISDLYLVQSSDGKIATASTASKAYSQDIYVKDLWYLTGSASDKDKISELTIGSDTLITGGAVSAGWADCVTLSSDGTSAKFKYPLSTDSGVGSLSFTVSATDAAEGTTHTGSEAISIKYDNTAPVLAGQSNSAFNISTDICQSNSWYTFGSTAYEAAASDGTAQSGFAYTAFYFKRNYTSGSTTVNNIYDILQAKSDAVVALGTGTIAALGSEDTGASDNTIVSDSGLYWYRKTISDISGNTFTVSDTTGVRTNALMKIDGSLYLITAVSGSSVTVGDTLPEDISTAYVAIAGIVDNTTPESAPSTGTIQADGYYASPSRDDGDRMIESVDKSGTSWAWEANVCSRNIADGPITLYYVVFDKAGTYSVDSVSGTVSNNKPRIAGAIVKTDYNGDGDVTDDGETINTYGAAKSYAEYYTGTSSSGAYIYDPDEKVKNTNAKNPLPTSVTYGADDEPIAALRGYTLIQPEIVGGNGALYYSYSVTNGSTVTSGNNSTAFIEEGSEDYTAVTGNINVQLGDLLKFGDTTDANTGIPFVFTIWDSTEGLTAFTSSQKASLTMYFAVQAAAVGTPSASITPFYWNSLTDNSVYGSSSASSYGDLKGHIELEDDWQGAEGYDGAASGSQYDADPKVSGKITIAGEAGDTKLIAKLTASVYGTSYEVATYSSETGLLASNFAEDAFDTNGFWFELVSQTVDSNGHKVEWKLHINTEKYGADKDLSVTMTTTNFGKPSTSTGGTLISIDGTTKYSSTLTYTDAASSTPGSSQTSASTATGFYRMDIVPYVVGVKTSLSSLKKKNSSVYDRTALGHYPTATDSSVYLYGFNLAGGTLYDSASSANSASLTVETVSSSLSWYSSSYFDYDTVYSANVSSFTSGNVYVSVSGISSLNNLNDNNASGSYVGASSSAGAGAGGAAISDASTYAVKNTYAYNRMPNNDNNNNLTDDLVLDVWAFDSDAVVPISGKIEQPHMGIDPKTGQIGFAFVNGPLYFSMAGSTEDSTKTSYDYWMGSYDFFTSVGFAYDSLGYTYGVAAGGDINSSSADKFQFMTSRWGRAGRAQSGSYGNSNSLRLESIGMKGTKSNTSDSTYYFDKQRIKSPSIATAVHDAYTNVYLAYYDAMNDEIRFKAGSTNATSQKEFGSFTDYDTAGTPYVYRNAKVSLLAGDGTDYGAGSYVSLGVIPGSTRKTDVVVAIWYDETNRVLWYSYNDSPITDRNGTTDRSGWSTPVQVFTGDLENAGEYCQVTVDANGGIHIAAYDGTNCDLVYAYLSSYTAAPATCVVDGSGVIGSNITIDVALDSESKAIPRIGYYATSCIRPKLAYLVDTTSTAPAGSDDEAFTGAWECSVVPTNSSVNMQSNQYNKINVGVWKDSETGVIKESTSGTSSYYNNPNSYNSTSYGFVYGNGTSNAVLGYAIKVNSSSDAIETAQMQ